MKCQIPEISWHNRDPVLSVDIQPVVDDKVRLASAGSDTHVLIWYLTQDKQDGVVKLDLVTDLARHQRAVNCVRWSPSGEYLASSDDESVIFIWRQKPETETLNIFDKDDASDQDKETWINFKILRGHMEDVYDLSWSSNSNFLISGSIDNTAIVWDVQKGKSQAILQDHKGFVQGVAWDPLNKYLATLSTDRIFRIFDVHTKKVVNRCCKSLLPVTKESPFHEKQIRLFHDDTLQTFFRRLSFSPDGNLIVVPSGVADDMEGSNNKPLNTTYIFTRNSLKAPSVVLPSPDQFTIAVKFCPMLFELKPNKKKPVIPLPYRMIFAVATKSSVYLYDTQQKIPFGLISNIHYTRLTDLAWSNDGTILLVSSTDGYCSIVQFNENELGVQYKEKSIADIIKENTPREKEVKKNDKSKNSESRKNASQVPQKIAVKRKPKVAVEQKENKPETEVMKETTVPEKSEEKMDVDKVETQSPPKIPETVSETIKELIPVDKIIRSDEKFESPKKNDSPVTPIPIRKHPRTVTTPSVAEENSKKTTPTKQIEVPPTETITPTRKLNKQSKTPTPIAVRRKPRVLQPQSAAQGANNIQSSPLIEEENGVWPIDESVKPSPTNNEKPVAIPTTSEGHRTPKTPRRVELITISTPKSKKKLDNN